MRKEPGTPYNIRLTHKTLAETQVKYDSRGLVPAIVQDEPSGQVLMMAWMDAEALELTLAEGTCWFWSRSRSELWHKGETSGNILPVTNVLLDCDADTLLILVDTKNPACHTGERSCFHREIARAEGR